MNREEILAKSREENKDKDLVSAKADSKACNIAIVAASVYAAIIYCIQIFTGNGVNFELFSMVTLINAVMNVYKGIVLKKKSYIFTSAVWIVLTIMLAAAAFSKMFA